MTIHGKFSEGDRVQRLNSEGIMRHGTIVAVYQSYRNYLNEYLILYSVQWDDTGLIQKGFMDVANGLTREETKLDRQSSK